MRSERIKRAFAAFDVCEYGALWWTGLSVLAIVAGIVIAVTA